MTELEKILSSLANKTKISYELNTTNAINENYSKNALISKRLIFWRKSLLLSKTLGEREIKYLVKFIHGLLPEFFLLPDLTVFDGSVDSDLYTY